MKSLFIASTTPYSGKSMISLGIGKKFKSDGYTVGYMKPYGKLPVATKEGITDQDALFIKESLGLTDPIDMIAPVVLTHDIMAKELNTHGQENFMSKIKSAYNSLSKNKDVLLIGGAGNLYDGTIFDIAPLKIIKTLNAKTILVDPYLDGACLDCMFAAKELLNDRLLGVIINQVGPNSREYVEQQIVPYLRANGINTLGVIPKDKVLNAISAKQINHILNGEVIAGHNNLNVMAENLNIGAMNVDDALRYFSRKSNKAVITGGDRPDIQLAALETSTSCLVLTGHMRPNEIIIAKADAKGVPIIISKEDTFTTIEILDHAIGKIRIRESKKVARAEEVIDKYIDIKTIYSELGID